MLTLNSFTPPPSSISVFPNVKFALLFSGSSIRKKTAFASSFHSHITLPDGEQKKAEACSSFFETNGAIENRLSLSGANDVKPPKYLNAI